MKSDCICSGFEEINVFRATNLFSTSFVLLLESGFFCSVHIFLVVFFVFVETYRILTAIKSLYNASNKEASPSGKIYIVMNQEWELLAGQLELLTRFMLLFDRLHGLHDLLLLDAELLFLFCLIILASEVVVITCIVPRLRLLEDLVQRSVVILQSIKSCILRLGHGWNGIERAPSSEKIG